MAAKILEIRVAPPRDALDRFEAAWNRLAEGQKLAPLRVLSLEDLPAFSKALTPARWVLLRHVKENGPMSIYELARQLERNYKNVHTDVRELMKVGLIERQGTEISVGWDAVRAELRF